MISGVRSKPGNYTVEEHGKYQRNQLVVELTKVQECYDSSVSYNDFVLEK